MDPRKPEKPSKKLQPKSSITKSKTVSSELSISPELSKTYCSRIDPLRGAPLVMDSDLMPGYIHVPSASSEPVGTPSQYMSGMMAVDPEDVMGSAPSSPFIGMSKKNKKKSLKFRPRALNLAQVAFAAPDRRAAYLRQMAMEEHMCQRFGDESGAAAGSVGDSMNLGNYHISAPENLGDNQQWDAEHLPLFFAEQRKQREQEERDRQGKRQGGSRKRTKKYTRKQRRSRRKPFRKRK